MMPEDRKPSLREMYNMASQGDGVPDVCIVTGQLVNLALGTDEYEAGRMYMVSADGIKPVDETS